MIAPIRERRVDRPDRPRNYVWISEIGGRVVGLARLVEAGSRVARIISLRVDPQWCHTTVPAHLIRSIQHLCRQRGYGEVVLASGTLPRWMLRLLQRQGFRLLRSERTLSGPAYWLSLPADPPEGD